MKRIITLFITFTLLLTVFTACSDSADSGNSNDDRTTSGTSREESKPSGGDIQPQPDLPYILYASEQIDASDFDSSLFDGRIILNEELTINAPITYEKLLELGFELHDEYIDEANDTMTNRTGTIRFYNREHDFRIGFEVGNITGKDTTLLDCFKEGVFRRYHVNEYFEYGFLNILSEKDWRWYKRIPHDEFFDAVFGELGVPSLVVKEEVGDTNFLYVYEYDDYYIVIGVWETEKQELQIKTYEYVTRSYAEEFSFSRWYN